MAVTAEGLVDMTDDELRMLRSVSGGVTVRRIDAEFGRRSRVRRQNEQASRSAPPADGELPLQRARRGTLILRGLPPSHNEIWIPVVRSGVPTIVLSDPARRWTKDARAQAETQWLQDGSPVFDGPVNAAVLCLMRDDRLDTQNLEKLLWDTLEGVCYRNDRQIRDRTWRTVIRAEAIEGLLIEIEDHVRLVNTGGTAHDRQHAG